MPSSPSDLDFETLLAPISAEAPAGASLRYEGTYDKIREARREDDPSLPQGVWSSKLKVADFRAVAAMAAEAIEHKSKDLQLAVWLAEAWARMASLAGAGRGVSFIGEMVKRYWDDGFPLLADDGGAEARSDLVDWLDEALAREVRRIPLAPPQDGGEPYRLLDWEAGAAIDPRADARAGEGEAPATREGFLARASLLGKDRWIEIRRDASAGAAAVERLEATLAEKMPRPPAMRRFKEALRALLRVCESMPGLPREEAAPAIEAFSTGASQPSTPLERSEGGPIGSRAEAYIRLSEAADYLLRTEPHSPVPYLVKRAVSWGNMSLAELLYEFVQSPDDLVTIQRLLGMRGKE